VVPVILGSEISTIAFYAGEISLSFHAAINLIKSRLSFDAQCDESVSKFYYLAYFTLSYVLRGLSKPFTFFCARKEKV